MYMFEQKYVVLLTWERSDHISTVRKVLAGIELYTTVFIDESDPLWRYMYM